MIGTLAVVAFAMFKAFGGGHTPSTEARGCSSHTGLWFDRGGSARTLGNEVDESAAVTHSLSYHAKTRTWSRAIVSWESGSRIRRTWTLLSGQGGHRANSRSTLEQSYGLEKSSSTSTLTERAPV